MFFLTYDLRKKRDYQKLCDELAKFKAVRVLESTRCFNRVNTTSAGLRDYFKKFTDDDDGLLLGEEKSRQCDREACRHNIPGVRRCFRAVIVVLPFLQIYGS